MPCSELVQRYLYQHGDNCFVCAVMNVQHSVVNNKAVALLDDSIFPNTLGIFSKTDLGHPADLLRARFNQQDMLRFGYGVCEVSNQHTGDTLAMDDFRTITEVETDFAQSVIADVARLADDPSTQRDMDTPVCGEHCRDVLATEFGIHHVQERIRTGFEMYLCDMWAGRTVHELVRKVQDCEAEIDACGYPFASFGEYETKYRSARAAAVTARTPDLGSSCPSARDEQAVAETVCARVLGLLQTLDVVGVVSMEVHAALFPMYETHTVARNRINDCRTVGAERLSELSGELDSRLRELKSAMDAFRTRIANNPFSKQLVDAAMAHIMQEQGDMNLHRFPQLLTHVRARLTAILERELDTAVLAAIDGFVHDRLSKRERMLRFLLTGPRTSPAHVHWAVREMPECKYLVDDLATLLVDTVRQAPDAVAMLEIDPTTVVEDVAVTSRRKEAMRTIARVCRALLEIGRSLATFETNARADDEDEQQRRLRVQRQDQRRLRHLRRDQPAQVADLAQLPVGSAETRAQLQEMQAALRAKRPPPVFDHIHLQPGSRSALDVSLSLCRQCNSAAAVTVQGASLVPVSGALGDLLGDMTRLKALTLRECVVVGDGPRTSPLRLGIQRNTTMGSLTYVHASHGAGKERGRERGRERERSRERGRERESGVEWSGVEWSGVE